MALRIGPRVVLVVLQCPAFGFRPRRAGPIPEQGKQ